MAEAVTDERDGTPAHFYCHMCVAEIGAPNIDFTCPLCAGGFIEERLPPIPNISINVAGDGSIEQSISFDMDALLKELAASFGSDGEANLEISIDTGNGRADTVNNLVTVTGNFDNDVSDRGRVRPTLRFDVEVQATGGQQMVSMDNLSDNALGREGLDAIVMQFLNLMEFSGPPPLPRHKIDEIPKIGITEDVVNEKQQCSVCWEYFKLEETVRRLSCFHLYHEDCIVPWLVLHGTCPICRKSLIDGDKKDAVNAD
ncbi:E3 ubiquitin-protein ligase Iruka-like [Glossina fuscipes]|uniref:RING-type E3 ubiquitin transferase n=1 Tax=Glossina fuscipes TaxID=7396 RepID=A0A9C5YVE5_9MUSC|nr:E3 ubiquitin-protein ligase Iruka-like [Glossina fuscipes]